jgi:integrase
MASMQKRGKDSWLLVVPLGYDQHGKKIRKTKTIRASGKREAEKELAKFVVEVESGAYIAPEKMKLSSFVEEWEKSYAIEQLETNTLKTYRFMLKNHILPNLGHLHLNQIKTIQINSFLQQADRKDGKEGDLSANSRLYIYNVLNSIFGRAVDWNVLKESPMNGVIRPKLTKKKHEIYDEEDLYLLLEALQDEPSHWKVFVQFALETGLRRGELLALTWDKVNFEKKTITVSESLIYDNGTVIKGTKNVSSNRKISLRSEFMTTLKNFYLETKKRKMSLGERWEEKERFYIFANWENGKALYPSTPTNWLRKFITRHDLKPLRLHDLRHLHATWLILNGVPLKVVSERLGHSNISTTSDIYGHVLPSADQAAAETLDSMFSMKKKRMKSELG